MNDSFGEALKKGKAKIEAENENLARGMQATADRARQVHDTNTALVQAWPKDLQQAISELRQELAQNSFELVVDPAQNWPGNLAYLPPGTHVVQTKTGFQFPGPTNPAVAVVLRSTAPRSHRRFPPLTFTLMQEEALCIRAFIGGPNEAKTTSALGKPLAASYPPDQVQLVKLLMAYVENSLASMP